jgi:peptide deformylase
MALREIVKYPDPKLREISEPVEDATDPELKQLVEDMAETMYAASGAGLAAIQVGVPLRLFIVDAAIAGGGEEDPVLTFINPELVWLSDEKETGDEGCLSFPGIYVPISRSLRARIRATNLEGQVFELEGEGLLARAFQHESDHLDAKLLADYVGRIKRQLIERRLLKEQAQDG